MGVEFQRGIYGRIPRWTLHSSVELKGWCYLAEDEVVPAMRARVQTLRGSRIVEAFERTNRLDAPFLPANAPSSCGFRFWVPLSFGGNIVKLEAKTASSWISVYRTLIFRSPVVTGQRAFHRDRTDTDEEKTWPKELPLVTAVIVGKPGGMSIKSLECVRRQTFAAMEVIVVDDGDDPRAIGILDGMANASVLRPSGRNPADAKNLAVGRACGKWIWCLGPEDTPEATYLERCLYVLETEKFDVFGGSGQTPGGEPATRTSIYRKELWSKVGGYNAQTEVGGEDWDFWKRATKAGMLATFAPESRRSPQRKREPPHRGYDNLLLPQLAARENEPCAILLAMPFLTIGGAEASLSRICARLSVLGFRIVVVTTIAVGREHGDSSAWFEGATNEIFHLPRFLPESRWQGFLDYLIESRRIRLLWQVGSTYVYDQLPRLKQQFPELRVLDLLFNPVGHGASFIKYNQFIDHVVAEHSGMRSWLLENGWCDKKVTVIPNGLDLARFQPAGGLLRDDVKPFMVGYLGRLAEEKAPDVFIEIAAELQDRSDIEFTIAGGGPLEERIQKSLVSRRLNNVRMAGFVSSREFLEQCDVLVVCSRLDGRPNAVMEAQAMGVPVIASRVGGLPEMIAEGNTGLLVEREDVPGFVRAILELRSNRLRYEQMRHAALRRAEEHFSLDGSIDAYERLIRGLTKREATGQAEDTLGDRCR